MRDIYLIDFENVASDGLSGITYLSEDDQVIIFYSNNSNRLTMKMHILIGKSICNLNYFEVTVGGKNALDHQISTYLGYLIGTGAAQRSYYIVSRDMGYKHVANFWSFQRVGPRVRCVDSIKTASRLERNRREAQQNDAVVDTTEPLEPTAPPGTVPAPPETDPIISEPTPLPQEESPLVETEIIVPEPESTATPEIPEPAPEAVAQPMHRNRPRPHGRFRTKQEPSIPDTPPSVAPSPTPQPEPQEPVEQKEPAKQSAPPDTLSRLIAPYPKLQENVLRDLIANNKRQILCNTLRKHLGQEKGLALYNEIKRTAWH